jgi:hypothetical protein
MFLNFVGATALSSNVTFTRGTTATFVGSDGLIQTAAINAPRFDYDPVTLAAKGLLIEEQRTNLLTYSQDFTNALWVATASAKTSTNNLDPAGTSTALLITANGASTAHYLNGGTGISYTSGTTYTASAYVKAGSTSFAQITLPTSTFGAGQYANFELTGSGSVTASAGGTASIVPAGDGWYRVTFSAAATATASTAGFFLVFIANGTAGRLSVNTSTDTLYFWGAQLEAGSFATSYIPTVASQVTRSADVATMTGTNFSSWYNQSEGTLLVEADQNAATGSNARAVSANNGSVNESIQLAVIASGLQSYGEIRAGGVVGFSVVNGAISLGSPFKIALGYALNDTILSTNGTNSSVDTSVAVPTVTLLNIGTNAGGGNAINGHIRQIAYYNTRLSNNQLQGLTA